jgi:hypothetical protein
MHREGVLSRPALDDLPTSLLPVVWLDSIPTRYFSRPRLVAGLLNLLGRGMHRYPTNILSRVADHVSDSSDAGDLAACDVEDPTWSARYSTNTSSARRLRLSEVPTSCSPHPLRSKESDIAGSIRGKGPYSAGRLPFSGQFDVAIGGLRGSLRRRHQTADGRLRRERFTLIGGLVYQR